MVINYNIAHLQDNRYAIRWEQDVPGKGREAFICQMTFDRWGLRTLLNEARNRMNCRLSAYARKDPRYKNLYKSHKYVWDGDTSNLQDTYKKQAADMLKEQRVLYGSLHEIKHAAPERLFYIEYYSDGTFKGPRLRKLEKPLMTWQEACEELKKKVA